MKKFNMIDEGFVCENCGKEVEKLFRMTKFTDEGIRRFTSKLRRMGLDDKLKEQGIEEGDIVRILDFEFEYRD